MSWTVGTVRYGKTIAACAYVVANGGEAYCPVIKNTKRISRTRRAKVLFIEPAYPGYVFVKQENVGILLSYSEKISIMKNRLTNDYLVINDDAIELIKQEEKSWQFEDKNFTLFKVNDKVQIQSGLMKGQIGEVIKVKSLKRIIVCVNSTNFEISPLLVQRIVS
jgi:transcription antitermination factor NusG